MVALKKILKEEVYPEIKKKGKTDLDKKVFMKCFEEFTTAAKLKKKIKELKKEDKPLTCEFGTIEMDVLDSIMIKINEGKDKKSKKKDKKSKKKNKKEKKTYDEGQSYIKLLDMYESGNYPNFEDVIDEFITEPMVEDDWGETEEKNITEKMLDISSDEKIFKKLIKKLDNKEKKDKKKSKKKSEKKKSEKKDEQPVLTEELIEKREFCKTWEDNKKNMKNGKAMNPITNRAVAEGSRTFKKFDKECKEIKELLKDAVEETHEIEEKGKEKTADEIFCEKWEENKKNVEVNKKGEEIVKNPKSNREVKLGSRTFDNIEKKCKKLMEKKAVEEEKKDDDQKLLELLEASKDEVKEMKKDIKKDLTKTKEAKEEVDFVAVEQQIQEVEQKDIPEKTNELKELLEKVRKNELTNDEIDTELKRLKLDNDKEYLTQILLIRLEQMS